MKSHLASLIIYVHSFLFIIDKFQLRLFPILSPLISSSLRFLYFPFRQLFLFLQNMKIDSWAFWSKCRNIMFLLSNISRTKGSEEVRVYHIGSRRVGLTLFYHIQTTNYMFAIESVDQKSEYTILEVCELD